MSKSKATSQKIIHGVVRIEKEDHKAMKIIAVQDELRLGDVVQQAFDIGLKQFFLKKNVNPSLNQ